jgi:hypothetical protein
MPYSARDPEPNRGGLRRALLVFDISPLVRHALRRGSVTLHQISGGFDYTFVVVLVR